MPRGMVSVMSLFRSPRQEGCRAKTSRDNKALLSVQKPSVFDVIPPLAYTSSGHKPPKGSRRVHPNSFHPPLGGKLERRLPGGKWASFALRTDPGSANRGLAGTLSASERDLPRLTTQPPFYRAGNGTGKGNTPRLRNTFVMTFTSRMSLKPLNQQLPSKNGGVVRRKTLSGMPCPFDEITAILAAEGTRDD